MTVLVLIAAILAATTARAQTAPGGCEFDPAAATTSIDIQPLGPTFGLVVRAGGAIEQVDPIGSQPPAGDCGTTATVDTIAIGGADVNFADRFSLFVAPDAFAPGATDEPGTSDEIEFTVSKKGLLELIHGTDEAPSGPATVVMGGREVNLNADEAGGVDSDLTVDGPKSLVVVGSDRGDLLDARGGSGTPSRSFELPLDLLGRNGADAIFGAPREDVLKGGTGNDELIAGDGADSLGGDKGNDVIKGEEGADKLIGDNGNDRLIGGPGRDVLIGGKGRDVCVGGTGPDVLSGTCEVRRD